MINKQDIIYTFKKSYNIIVNEQYFCCLGSNINLYDVEDGILKASFKKFQHPNYAEFIDNQRLLIKNTKGYYNLYDLSSFELSKQIKSIKPSQPQDSKFIVTPDYKYIVDFVYFFPDKRLLILNIDSGESKIITLGKVSNCHAFYDNNRIFLLANSWNETTNEHVCSIYVMEYPIRQETPEILAQFAYDFGVLRSDYLNGKITISDFHSLAIYDISTNTYNYLVNNSQIGKIKWSKNGKYIVNAAPEKIQILNVADGSCIKTYEVEYGCFADFYDNDTKLLIGTWNNGYLVNLSL